MSEHDPEVQVSTDHVARMQRRLWRLGSAARREAYIERARRRIGAGHAYRADAATVLAAGG